MNIWVTYYVGPGDYGSEYSAPKGFFSTKELAQESIKEERLYDYAKRQWGFTAEEEVIQGPIKNFAVFVELVEDSCEAIPELLGIYSEPAKAHEAARGYERDNDWAQCRVEEWEVE